MYANCAGGWCPKAGGPAPGLLGACPSTELPRHPVVGVALPEQAEAAAGILGPICPNQAAFLLVVRAHAVQGIAQHGEVHVAAATRSNPAATPLSRRHHPWGLVGRCGGSLTHTGESGCAKSSNAAAVVEELEGGRSRNAPGVVNPHVVRQRELVGHVPRASAAQPLLTSVRAFLPSLEKRNGTWGRKAKVETRHHTFTAGSG